MSCFIPFSLSLIHHLDGDVRAITFTLITANTAIPLHDLIRFEGEDLNRTDLHADEATLTVDLVPNHI
jgi:hypothetical protein